MLLIKIDKNNIHKYGVIKPGEQNQGSIKIDDIVEKPMQMMRPLIWQCVWRYILNPAIFKHLKLTKSDKSGEIQLTDAIKSLLNDEDIYATIYNGEKFDCGSKEGFVHATISLALRDESINKKIKKIIQDIV